MFRQRIRALASVDDGIDLTMRTLQTTGELDDTWCCSPPTTATSSGSTAISERCWPTRRSIRVPLLVRGPGLPQGVTRAQTVTTVDLAATILDATGVAPGRLQDDAASCRSRSPKPSSDTTTPSSSKPEDNRVETPAKPWMYRGVRTDRYTFVKWTDGFVELYDRRVDPFQLRNLAGAPAYARVVSALAHRTVALKDCAGASCRKVFGPLPGPTGRRALSRT